MFKNNKNNQLGVGCEKLQLIGIQIEKRGAYVQLYTAIS